MTTGGLGRTGDLEAVVVGPDEQMNGVAAEAAVSGDGVGADLLERVSEVRLAVGVLDGGGDVEGGHGRAPVMATRRGDDVARGVRMREVRCSGAAGAPGE